MQTVEEYLICVVRLKEKVKKVCNEDDNLAIKATPKEHSPLNRAFSSHNLIIQRYLSPLLLGAIWRLSKHNQNNNS